MSDAVSGHEGVEEQFEWGPAHALYAKCEKLVQDSPDLWQVSTVRNRFGQEILNPLATLSLSVSEEESIVISFVVVPDQCDQAGQTYREGGVMVRALEYYSEKDSPNPTKYWQTAKDSTWLYWDHSEVEKHHRAWQEHASQNMLEVLREHKEGSKEHDTALKYGAQCMRDFYASAQLYLNWQQEQKLNGQPSGDDEIAAAFDLLEAGRPIPPKGREEPV
jgi:hypothetical protein